MSVMRDELWDGKDRFDAKGYKADQGYVASYMADWELEKGQCRDKDK